MVLPELGIEAMRSSKALWQGRTEAYLRERKLVSVKRLVGTLAPPSINEIGFGGSCNRALTGLAEITFRNQIKAGIPVSEL